MLCGRDRVRIVAEEDRERQADRQVTAPTPAPVKDGGARL